MTNGNIFDAKLQAASERLERVQAEFAKSHEGTPPEGVWSGNEPKLLSDFIDFVKARGLKGAVQLETQQEAGEFDETLNGALSWSIRGYGIGVRNRGEPATSLPFDVFICEDKMLRTWQYRADGPFSFSSPNMFPRFKLSTSDKPVEHETISPNFIGNPWGPPDIGHFVLDHVDAEYDIIKGTYHAFDECREAYWDPDIKRELVPAHNRIDFEALELEFLLTAHSTVAAVGQGALSRREAAALGRDRVEVEEWPF